MQATAQPAYDERMSRLQTAMKGLGLGAVVLEPGPAMTYLAGVRWWRSERTFAMVLPARGEAVWVVPAFEEMRARELIRPGSDIRAWQEDESPFERIVQALGERGAESGGIGMDDGARFFVFDGIRKLAPKLELVSATPALEAAGVPLVPPGGRGR